MRELINTKSSDYNVIIQLPWAEWLYKIKTLFKYSWLKGERDTKIEWQDGLWLEENEWDGLWFEGNEWYYGKSRGDVRLSDNVMIELECYPIYNQYFLLDISGVDYQRLSALHKHNIVWRDSQEYLSRNNSAIYHQLLTTVSEFIFSEVLCFLHILLNTLRQMYLKYRNYFLGGIF